MTRPSPRDARRDRALEILRNNRGFRSPERLVDYAVEHGFRPVDATSISSCPECGSPPERRIGRYVYYSNQGALLECGSCGLIWSNLRLPPEVVEDHFEERYKEDAYFEQRRPVFEQMSSLVDRHAPAGGRVLDVGGAKGHLMAEVARRRPDLDVTVNDVSGQACAAARSRFGLRTIRGSIADLADSDRSYDVVVLCDVIYCEPDLGALWTALEELAGPHGTLILRVPNKLKMIELGQLFHRLAPRFLRRRTTGRGRVPWFNPEHLFIFTRSFLYRRLRRLGYDEVRVLPARPLGRGVLPDLVYLLGRAIHRMTRGRVLTTPAMIFVASRVPREG